MAARIMMTCYGKCETLEHAFEEASTQEMTMEYCGRHEPAVGEIHEAPRLGAMHGTQPKMAPWVDEPCRQCCAVACRA